MGRTVTAKEANQNFSRILAQASAGETITITRRGEVAAQLVPPGPDAAELERQHQARIAFVEWARKRPIVVTGPWTRDELYD